MQESNLIPGRRGHISRVVYDLLSYGWSAESVPEGGVIPRNGLKLVLRTNVQEIRVRIFAYKVTTSGRGRPHERRIEITTTYQGSLSRARGYKDVVLGVEPNTGKYVGVDSRRLRMGGPTHNASSFFDVEGLSVESGELLVNPRHVVSPAFRNGVEQHSFFDPSRLSEYMFNHQEMHLGRYTFRGEFSGKMHPKRFSDPTSEKYRSAKDVLVLSSSVKSRRSVGRITPKLITSVEEGDLTQLGGRKLTPAQLKEILRMCEEIGSLGEQVVLAEERKRLRRVGLKAQANAVERVSLRSVGEGYDILSFENDGTTKRYLEVKTTTGRGTSVEVSRTEWNAARTFGDQYYLVRVMGVKDSPEVFYIGNPVELENRGMVGRTASGWSVDLHAVL